MLVHKEVLRNIHKYLIKTKNSTVFSPITSMQHPINDNFHHRIYSLD